MRTILPVACAVGLAAALAVAPMAPLPAAAATGVTDAALAARWAPIHYQDTDSSDYDADYLTAVDYDGDWDALNNWEHQDDDNARLRGTVYYSVTETPTHWFLVYSFFHPRDWSDNPILLGLDTHENDMEGVLFSVRRDGSTYGTLEGAVTVAHSDFYSFTPTGSPYRNGRETIDGTLRMQTFNGVAHPTTSQEAKGHGAKAWNGSNFPGGDGVVYYPSTASSVNAPTGGNDRNASYRLVDTFASGGLWARRNDAITFASFGTFRGDNGSDNAANTAWKWDDGNDGSDLQAGLLATDPAKLVSAYFDGEGTFSLTYTSNRYR